MKRLINSIKSKIYRIDKEKIFCFTLLNHLKIYDDDPNAIEKVQRDLANIGVLTSKFNMNLVCFSLANPDAKIKEITRIFKKYNFKVKLKSKGKEVDKYQKVIKILPKK